MVETDHHVRIELQPEEKQSLRLAREEHRHKLNIVMRTLDRYCDRDARRKGLICASDVRQVLGSQTFTNISRRMLTLKEMPRHRQADVTHGEECGGRQDSRATHISPKRVAYPRTPSASSPFSQGLTPLETSLSPTSPVPIEASSCEAQLVCRRGPPPSSKWIGRRGFTISLDRPLPLSYEAQCDLRSVSGARRRSSLHMSSGFAPLFSKASRAQSHESPTEGTVDTWTAQEEAALRFLRVESALSPRHEVEARQREKHRWDRKKGPTKSELNTPKRMPDLLGKQLPKAYTPSCVERRTESVDRYVQEIDAKVAAARARVATTAPYWHY